MIGDRINPAEVDVVWVRPLDGVQYVRESNTYSDSGTAQPPGRGDQIVWGYTTVPSNDYAMRRVFYLRRHDRFLQPDGIYAEDHPAEAVDPRQVVAGKPTPSLTE
jgi:hypothetical protein